MWMQRKGGSDEFLGLPSLHGGVGAVFRRSSGGTVGRFDQVRAGWVEVEGVSISRAIWLGDMNYEEVSDCRGQPVAPGSLD